MAAVWTSGRQARAQDSILNHSRPRCSSLANHHSARTPVVLEQKPLKAAKKGPKDSDDEDDIAFKVSYSPKLSSRWASQILSDPVADLVPPPLRRCTGQAEGGVSSFTQIVAAPRAGVSCAIHGPRRLSRATRLTSLARLRLRSRRRSPLASAAKLKAAQDAVKGKSGPLSIGGIKKVRLAIIRINSPSLSLTTSPLSRAVRVAEWWEEVEHPWTGSAGRRLGLRVGV